MHGKCDLCVAIATNRVPVSIDGAAKRTLDLCDDHYEQLLRPVLDAVSLYGMAPQKIVKGEPVEHRQGWRRKVGPFRCRVPGCVGPLLKSGSTLTQHLIRLHDGLALEDYVDQYGPLKAATPEEQDEPVTVECDEEGCDQAYSTTTGTRWPHTAMISHMRGRHGLNWRPGVGVLGQVG